jgi:flagellar basal body-associated protein FliL
LNDDNNELFYSIFYFENPENINIKYSFDMNEIENKSSKLLIVIIIIICVIFVGIGIIIYLKICKKTSIEKMEEDANNMTFELEKIDNDGNENNIINNNNKNLEVNNSKGYKKILLIFKKLFNC